MREVLKKIDELVSSLESKNSIVEKEFLKIAKRKESIEEKENMLDAKAKNLSAMERIYKKYADFDKEKELFAKAVKEQKERIELANKQEENDAATLAQIKKERAELDKLKLVLNKQSEVLEEKELAFDKKKADLKGLLSGESIKEILK